MFRIKMLPARYGDSLWIEYGREANPHLVLIMAGWPPPMMCCATTCGGCCPPSAIST